MEVEKVLDVCFFGNEIKISGSLGEKSAKPSQKNGNKTKQTNKQKDPKVKRLVRQGANWVLGKGRDCVPACGQNASSKDMAMLGSVTEWVIAGQQTAICKHHEGKHQSTLDFFLYNFLL
jgi:hypothetical protein